MLLPSGLSLACRACARAFPTLRRESAQTTTWRLWSLTTRRSSLGALARRLGQEQRYAGGRPLAVVSTRLPSNEKVESGRRLMPSMTRREA
jgi:hypothetical protein